MTEKIVVAKKGFVRAEFSFWVGRYIDKLYDAFQNKKIIGNQCPKCGKVFLPPRKVCVCNETIELEKNWVDLPDTGILQNFTITPYRVNDRSGRKGKKSQIIGMIKIDGSDTAIIYRILNMQPDEVKIGMKVQVDWEENPKGDPNDIKGFTKL